MKAFVLCALGAASIAGCAGPPAGEAPCTHSAAPDGWVWVEAPTAELSFCAPSATVGGELWGTDSRLGQYAGPGFELSFDVGGWGAQLDPPEGAVEVVDRETVQDGRTARLVTWRAADRAEPLRHRVGLVVGDDRPLTMVLRAESEAARASLEPVLFTLTFE